MERILVIDDDVELCTLVGEYLQAEGFVVESVHDGENGLQRATAGGYLLVVLDVMLPGINGFEVLRRIRATSRLPCFCSPRAAKMSTALSDLEIGADDYLPKPFNPRELVARIRAILRRTRSDKWRPSAPDIVRVGEIELDPATRSVRRDGQPVDLTSVEFNLLEVLLREAGRVVPRERLVNAVLAASSRRLTAALICTSAKCARSWATPTPTNTSRPCAAWATFSRGRERRAGEQGEEPHEKPFPQIFLAFWLAQALFWWLAILVTLALRPPAILRGKRCGRTVLNDSVSAYEQGGESGPRRT